MYEDVTPFGFDAAEDTAQSIQPTEDAHQLSYSISSLNQLGGSVWGTNQQQGMRSVEASFNASSVFGLGAEAYSPMTRHA